MQIYPETKDPSETKDYSFDFTPRLASGETIVARTITFIDAAGTTSPSDSQASGIVSVWLSGGTHLSRAIYLIRVTTNGGRILEESFAVDIVDTVLGATAETDVERLTREIAELKTQRQNVALGNAVIDVWRDGRRVRKHISTMAELNTMIAVLERELAEATAIAGGHSRRRPISLAWSN